MIIKKKFNNNILLAEDENHNEVVLLGKSIAFEKKVGERIDERSLKRNSYLIIRTLPINSFSF